MNYYERHIGDYLKDTAHLSLLHHGIYARLLDVYYTREQGFAEGEAHRLIGARTKEERATTDEVLAEFFVLTDGVWSQGRCDEEIARYRDKQEKAKRSADARWAANGRNANASASGDAPAMRTHSEGNAPSLQSPVTKSQKETPPTPKGEGRFPEFWNLWPRSPRKGGRPEALKVWQARNLDREADLILAHVRSLAPTEGWTKQGGEFVPAPVVYLRGRRWDGADTPETRAAATQTDWRSTRDGVQGRAYQLGFGPYAEIDAKGHGVSWASYRQQVITADQAAKAPA